MTAGTEWKQGANTSQGACQAGAVCPAHRGSHWGLGSPSTSSSSIGTTKHEHRLPVVQEHEGCDARLTFLITAAQGALDSIPHLEGERFCAVMLSPASSPSSLISQGSYRHKPFMDTTGLLCEQQPAPCSTVWGSQ